jgi:hypothetical protein
MPEFCDFCNRIPFDELRVTLEDDAHSEPLSPTESHDAQDHQPNLAALDLSSKTCSLCKLINNAILQELSRKGVSVTDLQWQEFAHSASSLVKYVTRGIRDVDDRVELQSMQFFIDRRLGDPSHDRGLDVFPLIVDCFVSTTVGTNGVHFITSSETSHLD